MISLSSIYTVVMGRVPETAKPGSGTRNPTFGFWNCCGEMGRLWKVEQDFFIFFPQIFGIFNEQYKGIVKL